MGRQGPVQPEREAAVVVAERQQDRDELAPQAAEAELQHGCGGAVQPLRVVYGDHHGPIAGQGLERIHDPAAEQPRLRQLPVGLGTTSRRTPRRVAKKRGLQGSPARSRKCRKHLLGDVAEQVIKG